MPVLPGRHYHGPRPPVGAWDCPSCGQKNAGPLQDGCVHCGAGTEAERQRVAELTQNLPTFGEIEPLLSSEAARITLARALLYYAEFGSPSPSELSRPQMVVWAQELSKE